MKNIHKYNFFKKKYGEHLLADVVTIADFKKYIQKNPVHRLTYFDITFITKGSESLMINQTKSPVGPGDVICSIPRDVWIWEKQTGLEGYALVFEEEFFLSFFNNKLFLYDLTFLQGERASAFVKPDEALFSQILEYLKKIKIEIQKGENSHVGLNFDYPVLIIRF